MKLFRNKMIYFICDDVISVNKALIAAILPLINNEHIKEEFIDEIIKEFNENPTQFVLNDQTLILHLKPSQNLNIKNGIALTYFTNCINFNNENKLQFVIAISSITDEYYQTTLKQTQKLFNEKKFLKKLISAESLKNFIEEIEKNDI